MSGYPIAAGNGWSYQTYDFSAYTNIYVRFFHVSNNNTWFLDDVQITLASPTLQVSLLNFSSISGKQATINWTNGSGNGRVVFLREASAGTPGNPVNGTAYTSSTVWSSKGTQLGSTGYYCIYNGNGSNVTISQLNPNTSYYVAAYEYNSYNNSYSYVTGAAIGNFTTKFSTASDYFRTAKSGVWNDNSTWETSPDNNTWYAAELVPDVFAISVTIRNSHLVTLTSQASCNVMNFRGGTIKLGNYNLDIVSSFDGNPNFVYDGTGISSKTGNLSSVLVTTVNPTSLPETLYSLTIDCGIGNLSEFDQQRGYK